MDHGSLITIVRERVETLGIQGKLLAKAVVLIIHEAPEIAEQIFSVSKKDKEYIPHLMVQHDTGGHTLLWDFLQEGQINFADIFLGLCDEKELLKKTIAGRSLLMAAVDGDRAEAATWLLRRWAAHFGLAGMHFLMEEESLAGYSALWWCGMDGRESAASALLAYGADDHRVDRNHVSCVEIARQRQQRGMLALYDEAERAYFLTKVRHLTEVGRAVGPDVEKIEHGEEKKTEDGSGGVDNEVKFKAVIAFVMRDMASDLAVELGLWMR